MDLEDDDVVLFAVAVFVDNEVVVARVVCRFVRE